MANSIAKTVQTLIDNDLSIQDALHRGYANHSALARLLLPRVREALGREVKFESIRTSVKRYKTIFQSPKRSDMTGIVARSTINVRTDVAKVTFEKTRNNMEVLRKVLADFSGTFLQVLEGTSTVTLVLDQRLYGKVSPMFRREGILDEKQNLAAVIVQSPKEIIDTPGCAIAFYSPVSRRRVNIEETVSCFTDTILILRMEDVGEAFNALTELIAEARKSIR